MSTDPMRHIDRTVELVEQMRRDAGATYQNPYLNNLTKGRA
jgi:hypothetical protein